MNALERIHADAELRRRRRRSQSRKRRIGLIASGAIVLIIGAMAAAALLSRANLESTATVGDFGLFYARAADAFGGGDEDGGPLDDITVTGYGTCTATLADGIVTHTWSDLWDDSTCWLKGYASGAPYLSVENPGTEAVEVSPEYPADYGPTASGEPIEVTFRQAKSAFPISFPATIAAGESMLVSMVFDVNETVADPGVSYSGQIGLNGTPVP